MRQIKTDDEQLWAYLVKKLGNTKTAKQIFNRVSKKRKARVIEINFKVDKRPLMEGIKLAKALTNEISIIKIRK